MMSDTKPVIIAVPIHTPQKATQYAPAGYIALHEAMSWIARKYFGESCTQEDHDFVANEMLTAFSNRDLAAVFEKTQPATGHTRNSTVTVDEWREDSARGLQWIITGKRTHEKNPRLNGLLLSTQTEEIRQWARGIQWRGELPPIAKDEPQISAGTSDVSDLITRMVNIYRNESVSIPSKREMAQLVHGLLEQLGTKLPKSKIELILKNHPGFPKRVRGERRTQAHHDSIDIARLLRIQPK
jgi:hypothetical protein